MPCWNPFPTASEWERGPRIVAIGGGTGLSTMLRGLKNYTRNLTAVVTVADDGGGSGMLRRDMGMPPPGDIPPLHGVSGQCGAYHAAAAHLPVHWGALAGQSFGNLILAALNGVTGSFEGGGLSNEPGAGHHRPGDPGDQRRCTAGGCL